MKANFEIFVDCFADLFHRINVLVFVIFILVFISWILSGCASGRGYIIRVGSCTNLEFNDYFSYCTMPGSSTNLSVNVPTNGITMGGSVGGNGTLSLVSIQIDQVTEFMRINRYGVAMQNIDPVTLAEKMFVPGNPFSITEK